MQGELVTKRTQFSSCDECRRSRVACDASARGKVTDNEDFVSCTRCLNRRRPCTFKWVQENKASASRKTSTKRKGRRRRASTSASEATTSQQNESTDPIAPICQPYRSPHGSDWSSPFVSGPSDGPGRSSMAFDVRSETATSPTSTGLRSLPTEFLSSVDSQWLSTVYHMGFDTVFGSWLGRYSNPFVNENPLADKYVSVTDLCTRLDNLMADEDRSDQDFAAVSHRESEQNRLIDQSLRNTILAFSSRWLPLASTVAHQDSGESTVIQALWRYARRDMLRIMNRPCYRSMLSLFLFALTPIPAGISEEEEVDGISGQACVHAALQHVQTLRARQRNLQFSGSKVSICTKKQQPMPTSPESVGTSGFITAESTAYWAALTFDTSASLTLNCRSLLSSGLFGHDEELSWRLVRTCAKMFDETAKRWQPGSLDMTDERANQIVGAGAAWKLLGWKLTAIFKEALRDGHEESKVMKAYTAVVESIRYFNTVFRPHLEACQQRMQFLGQQTKLRWYSLMLHYHLSILMLVDIIEASDQYNLLADINDAAADAENTVMNTLVFGLHNTYTLNLPSGSSDSIPHNGNDIAITVPLTSIDPYPHHIVAGVQLVRKAIARDYGLGKITDESHANLQLTMERTLSLLPQSSKSVQAARAQLSEKVSGNATERHQDPYGTMQGQFTVD